MTFSGIYETAGVRRLPVSPIDIARSLGITVINYKTAAEIFETTSAELYLYSLAGFSFTENGRCCIVLNENACCERRRRFTAAHELAHCVLGHLGDGGTAPTKKQEREAEHFAAELLAPLVVVRSCGIRSAEELARMCGISKAAAENRLYELAERERCGFCATEDELRITEIFREFTEHYSPPRKTCYRKNLYIPIY